MPHHYLVTGGLGFVGKNLSRHLSTEGHQITILDKKSPDSNDQEFLSRFNLNFEVGDVLDEKQLSCLIGTNNYDGVFHLASYVGIKNYLIDPVGVIETTIQGTANLARSCARHNVHFIFSSTSEVLGRNQDTPWKESADRVYGATEVDRWCYGSSKGVAEQLVIGLGKSEGLSWTIVRFFNVYGDFQNPIFLIPKTISNCLNNVQPLIYDDGKQTRCFTYIRDAVVAMEMLMNDRVPGIFHIGSKFEHTVQDVVNCVISCADSNLNPILVDTRTLYGKVYEDIYRRVPDVSKIKTQLGWEATTNLEAGIRNTVSWVQKNPWWLEINSSVEAKI